ncbi:hypothetical protein B0H14DRAFT_3433875 [Mycena olivaceomarginata]|nr:hypothetical protein B0H14DRAFT_3433875 [Mycena olivaceomarginata]
MRDPPAPSRILRRLADQRAITRLMVSVVSIERFTKTTSPRWAPAAARFAPTTSGRRTFLFCILANDLVASIVFCD